MFEYKGCITHAIMIGDVIAGEEACPFCQIQKLQDSIVDLVISRSDLKQMIGNLANIIENDLDASDTVTKIWILRSMREILGWEPDDG